MAKKEESTQPVVTRLNLPISDESLMVDLPDGQKLVIGKMATGAVIEVATWRGTGRPDSRTTRMMLGMSGSGVEPTSIEGETPSQSAETTSRKDAILALIKAQFVKQDKPARVKKEKAAKSVVESSEPPTVVKKPRFSFVKSPEFSTAPVQKNESGSAFDIDAWIAEIAAKSATKVEKEKNTAPAKAKAPARTKSVAAKKITTTAKTGKPKSTTKSKGRGR